MLTPPLNAKLFMCAWRLISPVFWEPNRSCAPMEPFSTRSILFAIGGSISTALKLNLCTLSTIRSKLKDNKLHRPKLPTITTTTVQATTTTSTTTITTTLQPPPITTTITHLPLKPPTEANRLLIGVQLLPYLIFNPTLSPGAKNLGWYQFLIAAFIHGWVSSQNVARKNQVNWFCQTKWFSCG